MQRVRTRSENFSSFRLSLRVDSSAILCFSFPPENRFENGPTVGGTLVTCPKFLDLAPQKLSHEMALASLERLAQSATARIAAGTSMIAPVPVAPVRAEIPTSSNRPHK